MATGIDIGDSFINLVELDGSARKYRVSRVYSALRTATSGENDVAPDLRDDLARALEDSRVGRRRTLYAVPGAHCVLRNIVLPFKGRDEIRKVLKFEAESHIHSHSIDDVVVDACILQERQDGSELFMAACPKDALRSELEMLEKLDVETEIADLDAALLVEAASALDVFNGDPSGEEPGQVETQGSAVHELILGIGGRSVLMILVAGGRLRTARVLRWGFDRVARTLAQKLDVDADSVHQAIYDWLGGEGGSSGETLFVLDQDEEVEQLEGREEIANGDESPSAAPPEIEIHPDEFRAAGEQLGDKILGEIHRFVSGIDPDLRPNRILLTGPGALMPGLRSVLDERAEAGVELLDLLGRANGNGEPREPRPGMDLAFAASLACLGTTRPTMNFRQEELSFKRKFDRLKFPLALCCLLAAIVLFFMDLILLKGVRRAERMVGMPVYAKTDPERRRLPKYSGLMAYIGNPDARGLLKTYLDLKFANKLLRELPEKKTLNRIRYVRNELRKRRDRLEKKTGFFSELKLESGLAVLVTFSEAIDEAADPNKNPDIGRFVIPWVHLRVGTRDTSRTLKFQVVFRGEDFRQQNGGFLRVMRRFTTDGGYSGPFASVAEPRESLLKTGAGAEYEYTLKLVQSFDVYQPLKPRTNEPK